MVPGRTGEDPPGMHPTQGASMRPATERAPDASPPGSAHVPSWRTRPGLAARPAALSILGVPVWVLLLVSGAVLAPLYLAMPDAERDLTYLMVAGAAPVVIALAVVRYRPGHHVWTLVGLGAALMAAGELARLADAAGIGGG
jgi:hypothetical protein